MDRRRFLSAAAGLALVGAGATPAHAVKPKKLRVALLPDENAAAIIQSAQPFKAYLEQALGAPVEIIVTTDYSSMIEAMRFHRIEVAYFGPLSYVLAKSKAPAIEPFAVGLSKGSPTYRSVIVALADGPVKTIDDIKGKTFGFGDDASTSSHLIPRAYLARHRLVAGTDYKFVHLGAHDAVARAVLGGQVQAGGLSKAIFDSLIAKGSIDGARIRVLAESDPIPNYPMVMQGDLDAGLKAAIKKAFLDLKDPEVLKTFRADGFVATGDSAYDILRETAKVLSLDLTKIKG